jgi:phospholipid transport system substrate-binding protein
MTTWKTKNTASKWTAVYALSFLLVLAGAARSQPAAPSDAGGFIARLGSQAIHIMKDDELSTTDRQQRFRVLMKEDFDLPKIARFVLGRYWQQTSDTERQQFTDAFADYMAQMYSARFADYDPQSFRVIKQRADADNATVVSTEITRLATGQPIDVDWRVAKTFDTYKVTDISAGGASLTLAQRDEFSSAVRRSGGSVSNLIQALRVKVTELATSAH